MRWTFFGDGEDSGSWEGAIYLRLDLDTQETSGAGIAFIIRAWCSVELLWDSVCGFRKDVKHQCVGF